MLQKLGGLCCGDPNPRLCPPGSASAYNKCTLSLLSDIVYIYLCSDVNNSGSHNVICCSFASYHAVHLSLGTC